jgi:nucleoside-diphosphate-sugar epimerase
MIVAITGANGFLGRHLVVDQLARGMTVRAVDVHTEGLRTLAAAVGLEIFHADICDREVMKKIVAGADVVFHLASAHLAVTLDDEAYWRINRDGALALVRLCREAKVARFVHVSSVGVYGEIKNPPADETSACHPDLIYEKSKLAGEEAVLAYARQSGFPLTVIRPVWVYGPGCPRTEKLFRSLRKGTFFYVGNGRSLRHCLHISDFIQACELCAARPEAIGEVFIIGDAAAVTLRQLLTAMAEASGYRKPWMHLPLGLVQPLFACMEWIFLKLGREPIVSTRTLKFFTNNTAFSIAKARKLLGFEPQYGVAEGMRLTWSEIKNRSAELKEN